MIFLSLHYWGSPRKPSEAGCVGRRRDNGMERMPAVRWA
jgi:hypothetical protein